MIRSSANLAQGIGRYGSLILTLALIAGCASVQRVPPAVRSELAPTGKLRVGLILSNQVLVTKDPTTGELGGVTVSLGKALAAQLGVPFEPVGYANPAALVKSFGTNEWDIAFLAYDPARAKEVDFSPPYMEVDNSYLVLRGSKVQKVELADQPGVRIAVPERSAPDLYLSRNLKAAQVVRVPGGVDAAIEVLRSDKADAYAENAHMLSLYAEKLPGSWVLEGRYTVIQHAIATPKGRPTASEYVRAFVEEAKVNGTVGEAIRAAGLRRANVAPPAQAK
ncbi:transporter substrate-binding domain-containing protein [bacterium]|nr:MAG: transporter substrate-binding domain-containing protein [bacterium]